MSDTIISSIITGVISIIIGFYSGYKYCIKTKITKTLYQKAGDNATQIQVGETNAKE